MIERTHYDILVIGGGHAGAEAAWAAANRLADGRDGLGICTPGRVGLITMNPDKIGAMSCNPAIGGLAKGQMVREIDAMGGLMGLAADATGIQFKILNASKGPAVRGPRCQSDKYAYALEVQRLLKTRENLDILTGTVDELLIEDGRIVGIMFQGRVLHARAVVLTTGTFMRGLMHTGTQQAPGGRVGEKAATTISDSLKKLGFELGRLKTGTPPRLDAQSLDFSAFTEQPGDETPVPFSDMTPADQFPAIQQVSCWITHTNSAIHERIIANLDRAPMYNGQIETQGPRYCPSIEDKVVRFRDRTAHHVFLEPESLSTHEIYCNGISTSLPSDVQDEMVRQLPGCENAKILRYGYAVEYDMVWPHQIDATCMTKRIAGLFLAGQINGTSGYEEAAGQGLIAGINAVQFIRDESLIRLRRDQAYIGVLLDDLVTKIPREPYRMFTSRAEHRLLLRADNADDRLTPMARELGLVDDARWSYYQQRREIREAIHQFIDRSQMDGKPMARWICRPETTQDELATQLPDTLALQAGVDRMLLARMVADYQYAGYIERSRKDLARIESLEQTSLPEGLDYLSVKGLRREAALTLNQFQPRTLGQAGRLAGVNPADLMLISLAVQKLASCNDEISQRASVSA